jgi:hypothetical protein
MEVFKSRTLGDTQKKPRFSTMATPTLLLHKFLKTLRSSVNNHKQDLGQEHLTPILTQKECLWIITGSLTGINLHLRVSTTLFGQPSKFRATILLSTLFTLLTLVSLILRWKRLSLSMGQRFHQDQILQKSTKLYVILKETIREMGTLSDRSL